MKAAIYILVLSLFAASATSVHAASDPEIVAKHVRKYIKEGNEAYKNGDYAKAEVCYMNALQEDPKSEIAKFNYALALMRQIGKTTDDNSGNKNARDSIAEAASSRFSEVASESNNEYLVNNSYYNLGKMAFDRMDYAESINMYKEVLRRDPGNVKARQSLRVAQLKYKDQQSKNDQNEDQNQDQNQNQNKENDRDQKQNKDQQQNPPKQNPQQEDNKDQSAQNPQNPADKQQSPDERQAEGSPVNSRPSMSDENAEKILNAVGKQEEQTRKKVEERKRTTRRATLRPW